MTHTSILRVQNEDVIGDLAGHHITNEGDL